jgi:predicted DNA-binding transcriptional regulator YafY
MDALSLAHLPVAMDYGPGGGYYLPDDYRLDPATFTSDEAVALALGGAMAGDYRLFDSNDGLRRALVKLEAALPEEYRADVRAARERIFFDTTAWYRRHSAPSVHLETVRAAVWTARQLDLYYPSSDGPGSRWRRVEPHGLVCKAGVWYLVAYCHMRKAFRTFRVERIEDVKVREEPVRPRPGFDLQGFWEEARRRFEEQTMPLTLTLRVTAATLRRMRSGTVVLTEEQDMSSVVRLDAESLEAAVACVLSLGSGAIVLDPPQVREAVSAAVRAMAEIYGGVATLEATGDSEGAQNQLHVC